MKGKIVYNGGLWAKIFAPLKYQVDNLTENFRELGAEIEMVSSEDLSVMTDGERVDANLGEADFVVFLDKDHLRAKLLEKAGYKLFNRSEVIRICDDKALSYEALSGKVPIVPTLFPPLSYFGENSRNAFSKATEVFGFPMIVKTRKGSLGEGVFKAESERDYEKIIKASEGREIIFQKFYGKPGEDLRVIVVGGNAVCAMKRVNEYDFRANIERGGKGYNTDLTAEMKNLAEEAARTVGADYCGVDILFGDEGLKICEINSNAFFGGVYKATGVDVGHKFAEYIFERISLEKGKTKP